MLPARGDAFGRLVKILNQEDDTVTEYRYNGPLRGFLTATASATSGDSDGDEDLEWEWLAYDDKWRIIARFEDGADVSQPFEQLYHHHAGLAGYGGSSYIDLVICRDQLEYVEETPIPTREYILQNWRADVVALTTSTGDLLERVAYDRSLTEGGIAFATHSTDLRTPAKGGATSATAGYGTPSGVVNNDDYLYFLTLYGLGDWRADWNRDGVVDTDDHTAFYTQWAAATGSWGRGVLSNRGSILGYAGYIHEPATGAAGGGHGTMYHCRMRVHHAGLGRWIQRDPLEYPEGPNLYAYGMGSPITMVDAMGLACAPTGCPQPVMITKVPGDGGGPQQPGGIACLLTTSSLRDCVACCGGDAACRHSCNVGYTGPTPRIYRPGSGGVGGCAVPDDGTKSDAQMCDEYRQKCRGDWRGGGFVICRDGRPVSCVWFPSGTFPPGRTLPIMQECALANENTHHDDVDCSNCAKGTACRPGWLPGSIHNREECRSFIAHLECLQRRRDDCSMSDDFEVSECYFHVDRLIKGICNASESVCGTRPASCP